MPRGGPEQGKEDRGRPGLGSRDRIPVKDISSMIQVFDSIFFFFFFFFGALLIHVISSPSKRN